LEQAANNNVVETATGLIPNDPLYNSQWGIPACNIDDVWNTTTGDSTSIIAILDTGVDDDHPDLKKNIWKNLAELNGAPGVDDDGNGKVDDIWGWDFINNDNAPKDDNSHGTHCAGIAAAVGDNGIGIAGVNWKAQIMSIKVFQSSGQGDAATIAQGITYATENGATVLNMSFGSYANSLAMQDALANAYATAVLVAAAGNDALCIGPGLCPDRRLGAPLYPGAFSFVLGVEANGTSGRAGFSNFDQDGAVFSGYTDLLNYELKAPGTGILSCVPGGNYREYSGTSMAAPLVAGAVSLYRKLKPGESQEMLFGNFIHSINQHIDLVAALNIVPEPILDIVSYEVIDTLDGDGDGRADAGETIELKVMVRNTWGQANDVKVGIEFGEFEDTNTAGIQIDSALVGSISAYATRFNAIPLKIKIDENVTDGRDIVFELKTWYGNHLGESTIATNISVENGIELKGILNENLTLYPDKHYIITDNLAINEGVTLTIKPGAMLKFAENKSLIVAGNIIAIGKPDSTILFTKRDNITYWDQIKMTSGSESFLDYCIFEYGGKNNRYEMFTGLAGYVTNTIFRYNYGTIISNGMLFEKNQIVYNNLFSRWYTINDNMGLGLIRQFQKFSNNNLTNNESLSGAENAYAIRDIYSLTTSESQNNCIFSNGKINQSEKNMYAGMGGFQIYTLSPIYYGSSDEVKIKNGILDFDDDGNLYYIDISNKLITPPNENHGIVWKVVVNGKDAQDEFELLDPIGVGRQKIEVYFNRGMDTLVTPNVSMGVRYPYTQTSISKDGSWSADSSIYTAFLNVGLTTGDGINTIRVSGAEDTDHFEIPIEDRRFRVIVNGAGSLSSGFAASPGMGLVDLEWENPEEGVDDLLGYNMYRYSYLNDSVTSDTVMINSQLLTDTIFTDFSVQPSTKYFYTYKTMRTNLSESDYSKVVAATPFTAATGDANGDLLVNVSDIVTVVSYILENNPQPFIFDAGDVNGDETINVLDIVALVNLIMAPESSTKSALAGNAQISIEDGIVYVDSPVELGGIQFTLADVSSEKEVEILEALEGFEVVRNMKDGKLTILAYSLSGKTIPEGKSALLKLHNNNWIFGAILSDASGSEVQYTMSGAATIAETLKLNAGFSLGQNYPNPFTGNTTIPFELEMDVEDAVLSIYDIMGREVKSWQLKNLNPGAHQVEWNGDNHSGVFLYKMYIKQNGKHSYTKTKRMMIK
nr:S8 family serine peptidase [Prolixibacteraceae bacterium]